MADGKLIIEARVDSTQAEKDLGSLSKTIKNDLPDQDVKVTADTKSAQDSVANVKSKIEGVTEAPHKTSVTADTSDAETGIGRVKSAVETMADSFKTAAGQSSGSFGSIVQNIASITTGVGLAQIAVNILDGALSSLGQSFASAIQRVDTIDTATKSLTVLTGDADTAKGVMDDLCDAIQGTPIALDDVALGAKKMVAAGMEGEDVKDVFTSIADAAYGVGDGASSIDQMTDAIANIQASGTVYADDINRMVDAGVPAWQILANQTGKSVGEMKDAVRDGTLSSNDAISLMTKGIEEGTDGAAGHTAAMAGLAKTAGDTISGSFANMKTSFTRLFAEVVTQLKGPMISAMTGVTTLVNNIISGMRNVNSAISTFIQNSQGIQAFGAMFQDLGSQITSIFEELAPKFAPVQEAYSTLWASLGPVLNEIINLIATYLVPYLQLWWSILIQVIGWCLNTIAPLFAGIGAGLVDMLSVFVNTIGFIVALLQGDWSGAMDFMWKAADSAQQFLADCWNGIKGTIDAIFPGLIDSITGWFAGLPDQMKQIGDNVIQGFWDGVNGAKEWLKGKLDELLGYIPDWIKAPLGISSPSKVIRDEVGKYILPGLIAGVEQSLPDAERSMKSAVETLVDAASSVDVNASASVDSGTSSDELVSLAGTVKEQTDATRASIETEYPSMNETATSNMQEMAENVVESVQSQNDPVAKSMNAMSGQTQNITATMKNGISGQTSSMAASGINNTQTLATGVVSTMSPVPGQLNSIGQQMMNELKAGIDATKQSVIDSTSDLVQKLLDTFITGLGIHSPSRKMQWIGEMMAAGLLKGLSSDQIGQYTLHIIDLMQDSFKSGKLDINAVLDSLGDNIPALVAKLGVDTSDTESVMQFLYPLIGTQGTITSLFGYRDDIGDVGSSNHMGVDIAAAEGTPIDAVMGGTVTVAGSYGGYGNAVVIDHGNGLQTLYGHMLNVGTSVGSQVGAGSVIGYVGSTGYSTGNHLHISVIQDGNFIDPLPYLQGASISGSNTLAGALMAAYNIRKYGITSTMASTASAYTGGGDVTSWITQALQITGLYNSQNLANTVALAMGESGGNPSAVNDWDSNAAAGTPSKGLMQTIDSTFQAYALPGHTDIWNPVDNAIASIRYQMARYGYLRGTPGYWSGTNDAYEGFGMVGENGPELIYFGGGEKVWSARETQAMFNAAYQNQQSRAGRITSSGSVSSNKSVTTNNYKREYNINQPISTASEMYRKIRLEEKKEAYQRG